MTTYKTVYMTLKEFKGILPQGWISDACYFRGGILKIKNYIPAYNFNVNEQDTYNYVKHHICETLHIKDETFSINYRSGKVCIQGVMR